MPGDPYLHHVSTLIHVPAHLIEHGIDPGPVFRGHGISLSKMMSPDGWLTRESCLGVANEAVRLSGDRFIGVRQAQKYELEHLGAWGETVLNAPDLRRAIDFAGGSVALLETGTRLDLRCLGRRAQLRFEFEGRLGGDPRQHIEASLLVLRKLLLLAGEPDAVTFHSARESSRDVAHLAAFFGGSVQRSDAGDYLEFDRDLLDLRLAGGADSRAAGYLDTVRGLAAQIGEMLPYARPTIESIAPRLGMSVRTVQRRLRERGFTFEGCSTSSVRHRRHIG